MDKKQLKKTADKQICGKLSSNMKFAREFQNITGKSSTYGRIKEIKKIVIQEIDEEKITEEPEVLERAYEIIYELYEIDSTNENDRSLEQIINKGKVTIEIPYTSNGVMVGYGTGTFGGIGVMGSSIGEGRTRWRTVNCYLANNGLSIEETGDFISFDKIINYHKGQQNGLVLKHTNITLELVGDKTFTFRLWKSDMGLLKIIDANMRGNEPKSEPEPDNNVDGLDQLIKAKELLEAGLLTEEEFNRLKEKLLF